MSEPNIAVIANPEPAGHCLLSVKPNTTSMPNSQDPTTPRSVIFIVIITIAILAVIYMGTLAACLLLKLSPDEKVLLQFVAGGTYILGVLSGVLIRTAHTGQSSPQSPNIQATTPETTEPTPAP